MLHDCASFQLFQRSRQNYGLSQLGPCLSVPFDLLVDSRRGICNHEVPSLLDLLRMNLEHVPQLLVQNAGLRVECIQVYDDRFQYVAVTSCRHPLIETTIVL